MPDHQNTIVLLVTFFLSSQALAQASPADGNLREACRKQIAGIYLSLYDQRENAQAYIEVLSKKNRELDEAMKVGKTQLEHSEKQLAKAGYNLDLMLIRDGFQSQINMIAETQKNYEELIKEAQQQTKEADAKLKSFEEHMYKVFTKSPIKGQGASYKFSIQYHDPCPPYRDSCPLPQAAAKELRKLHGEETPLVCERYADYLYGK